MTKITIDRELLYSKISKLIAFVPDQTVIPAHENFLFVAKDEFITITSSDSNIQASVRFRAKLKDEMAFCVPAGLFVKTVNLFRENELHINYKDSYIELRSGKSKYKITLFAKPEDFPIIKTENATSEVSIPQQTLKKALKTVGKFTSADEAKSLYGINISCVDNKMVFTGAQTSHMARVEVKPFSIGHWEPFLFSGDFYGKISGLLEDKGEVAITHNKERMMMFTDQSADEGFVIKCLGMSHKYVNSESIFNIKHGFSISLNAPEFKDAIKRLALYSSKDAVPSFTMARFGPDIALTSIDMDTKKEGEEFVSAFNFTDEATLNKTFNCKFMNDILSQIEESEIDFAFSDADNLPVTITPRLMEDEHMNMKFAISGIVTPKNKEVK